MTAPPKRFYRVYRDSMLSLFHLRATPRGRANFIRFEFSEDDVQKEGWLGQRGTFSRSWKLRYFLLRLDRSSLVCLRDRASLVQVYEEFIDRHTSVILEESANPQQFQFLVINRERQLRLNAADRTARTEWISAISELIVRSRASFFAGDESEGTMSVRSRTFRRMTTPVYTDNDDDASQSGYFTGINQGAAAGGDNGEARRKKRRKAWRAYKLVSATMQSRHDTDRLRRFDYFERFRKDIRKQIEVVDVFVSSNIDILEENLEAAEQLLSSAVAGVPKKDIAQLRLEAKESLRSFVDRVNDQLALEHANVLTCNALSRDLYLLVKRLHELILSFAPPVAQQATIKKITVESLSNRRRIPEDWFIEPKDYEKKESAASSSSVSQQSDRSVASDRESTQSTVNTSAGKSEKSSLSKSLMEIKASGGRRTTVTESSRLSVLSNALSGSDPIRIKPYVEMPVTLSEGHFDLPSGVNDFVVKVHDKDLGSLICFTLCSKAYVAELEAHFGNEVDIAKELAVEERLSFQRPSVTGGGDVDTPPTINRQVPQEKRTRYLEKMRASDVQHTDLKFSYDTRTNTHAIRCLTFFAAQFHALRALTEPGNLQFLNSVAESRRWDTTGGKSGAFFSMVRYDCCDYLPSESVCGLMTVVPVGLPNY